MSSPDIIFEFNGPALEVIRETAAGTPPLGAGTPANIGIPNAGTSPAASHSDHVHGLAGGGSLSIAAGKTLTVSNTLTLAGTDGKSLTLTGSLAVGADSSINGTISGGGTASLASGKTLTVSNSLTLAGTDGKTLTLTGSLVVGADVTISGGGTLALGGFSFTVPASGTAALLSTANTFTQTNTFTAGQAIYHTGAAGANRDVLDMQTAGVDRWLLRVNNTAEGGANAGSDLQILARTDAGAAVGVALLLTRATMQATFGGDVSISDGKNIIISTGVGTKIGVSTSAKIAFLGATPIARPSAYTLTGSATRTFPTDPSSAYTGLASGVGGTPYAALTDLNTLRTAVSTLIGIVRQMATDLGNTSGYGLLAA